VAVEQLDLSAFTAENKVVEGGPGRAAADPAVLVALWIYATTQGESSARGRYHINVYWDRWS